MSTRRSSTRSVVVAYVSMTCTPFTSSIPATCHEDVDWLTYAFRETRDDGGAPRTRPARYPVAAGRRRTPVRAARNPSAEIPKPAKIRRCGAAYTDSTATL